MESQFFYPEPQGGSEDGSHSIFRAVGGLATGATASKAQLYEVAGGELRLVCVRPSGAASKEACSAGTPGAPNGR